MFCGSFILKRLGVFYWISCQNYKKISASTLTLIYILDRDCCSRIISIEFFFDFSYLKTPIHKVIVPASYVGMSSNSKKKENFLFTGDVALANRRRLIHIPRKCSAESNKDSLFLILSLIDFIEVKWAKFENMVFIKHKALFTNNGIVWILGYSPPCWHFLKAFQISIIIFMWKFRLGISLI